ncbi:MAG: NADPH-dependent oxidoreductase [Alphaproteobacteria bacterium]|nr:NADPH-dependent oxidoreductase [Alphaproteobacteria bacterium]
MPPSETVHDQLQLRFNDVPAYGGQTPDAWQTIAGRQSCRSYTGDPVDPALLRQLCALALSSPTKSDLQQRDIVIVSDPDKRDAINTLFPDSTWIADAPVFLIFCGNNRRLRQVSDGHGIPFENDHLDAFFNAAVDAGIALSAFTIAAEAAGLGTCPISTIRDHVDLIDDLLELPYWVFPVAGMTVGWPGRTPRINLRLPLAATVHSDTYNEDAQQPAIEAYDARRAELRPYGSQRDPDRFGTRDPYTWSDDKARQYAEPQRTDFGAFVRKKGFDLT